jgi:hypothetical protein
MRKYFHAHFWPAEQGSPLQGYPFSYLEIASTLEDHIGARNAELRIAGKCNAKVGPARTANTRAG